MKRTFTKYPSNYIQASSMFHGPNGTNIPYTRYYGYTGFQELGIPENRYVIDARYFSQYAPGVTGQSRNRSIYAIPDGFRTKTEARQFMQLLGLKPYKKRGKSSPYGEVGARSLTIDITPAGSIKESFYDFISEVYFFDSLYE
jgi:hypothetical protein